MRLSFHFLQDVVELLVGGLVIGMVRAVFLQKIFAHLQFFLNVGGDCVEKRGTFSNADVVGVRLRRLAHF